MTHTAIISGSHMTRFIPNVTRPSNVKAVRAYIASDPVHDVDWHLPVGSWDSHVHVFEPAQYPYAPSHAYSPYPASYESLLDFNSNITITHTPQNIVLVQPSPYGFDNSLILDLLRNQSKSCETRSMRAISVISPENTTDDQLDAMNRLGVRGIRINAEAAPSVLDAYAPLREAIIEGAERVSRFPNWVCQVFVSSDSWEHIEEAITKLPIKVIADHQGGMKGISALPANVTDVSKQQGLNTLLKLAKTGRVFIKISGFYRSSKLTTGGYDDLEPLIKLFAREVPDQLIWGSDWPHTGSGANRSQATRDIPEAFRVVDNVAILENIRKWVGPRLWWKMTVETPEKIYA